MYCSSEETKRSAFRGAHRPVALQEKNFEELKLRSFREKRFHFESSASRKRLLPFAGKFATIGRSAKVMIRLRSETYFKIFRHRSKLPVITE